MYHTWDQDGVNTSERSLVGSLRFGKPYVTLMQRASPSYGAIFILLLHQDFGKYEVSLGLMHKSCVSFATVCRAINYVPYHCTLLDRHSGAIDIRVR